MLVEASRPKVSIITPVYNSELYLDECINSVLSQTYEDWEHIFIDDASVDSSVNIIRNYQQSDPRIILIESKTNIGAGESRNIGIERAKGQIVAFLDSDDIWVPQKLERHLHFMLENNAAFSHTAYGFIDEKGNVINKTFQISNKPIGYYDLLKKIEISCLTAMYDVDKVGKKYMPRMRIKEDYALWLSILKDGHKAIPLNEELAFYRQRRGSSTSKKHKLIIKHLRFLYFHERLGLIKTLYYTLLWALNGFQKYYLSK